MKSRIYIDICCFNRPYDDQTQLLVRMETEAKLFIQNEIKLNNYELAWSYMMDYENSVNPFDDRKASIDEWYNAAAIDIDASNEIINLANHFSLKGIKKKDSLHLACAIKAECNYFLTTDKKLLSKNINEITILNPIDFIRKLEEDK